MFGKLKDKLKGALSVFSSKAEEEAEVKEEVVEVVKEAPKKKEIKKEKPKKEVIKEEKKIEKVVEEKPKKEKKKVIKNKEEKPTPKEVEPVIEEKEEPKEKKGFFGKLKDVFSSEEKLELIDEKGKVIGEEARSKIHEEGLRHKEVHVIIFNDKEEILLQRRSSTTETHPNLLDSSVGGHVDVGEDWETAALRELKEETGIKADKEDLIDLGNFSNKTHDTVTNKTNNYLRKVYAYHFKNEKIELEKGKATSLEFWSIDKILTLSKEDKKEFIKTIISKTYLSYYEKLRELVTKEEEKEEPVVEEKKKPESKEKIETPKITEELEEKGFFGKIKQTLTTKTISAEKFEELFWDLEVVLLENNVSVEVIEKIKEDLKKELVDKPLPRDVIGKINETLKNTLFEILTYDKIDLLKQTKKPLVIALFGVNGAGKTTTVAKLAHYFKENGKTVVLAACDTFRAAAIQQLEEHATKLDVKIIKHDYGSDSAAVAFDAIKYAEKNNIDIVLIDTAGRLHSNANLMAELEKVIRVTNPDFKIFVGESITGNDCIEQAQKFNELVEMDGAILTKADVDEKGGAPLSISYVIKKPILFLGVGQGYDDMEEFDKNVILSRLGFE